VKILWVKVGGLVPLDSGGKIRSYHILRELSRRHDVTFFTSYAEHRDDIHGELDRIFSRVICHSLCMPRSRSFRHLAHYARGIFSRQPHQFLRYHSAQVTLALRSLLEREKFDVVVCDFLAAAPLIPWECPTPKVLFTHNVEALIWRRHCAVARNPLWKAISWREYFTTARAERRYLNLADHVLTVSETDRDVFARTIDSAKITVIPTGVDLEFFRPVAEEERPHTLVFTGSMDYMPNEDGVCYFVEQVLPRVRSHIPNVALQVVGRHPSPRLLKLASMTSGVEVTGAVDDIRPYVQRGSVYVVPLRVGSGTRLKIFEAMAMGKAVVSTSVGAEGLPVRPGNDILIADSPDAFANGVVRLLANRNFRSELGKAARELVARKHSWGSVAQHFEFTLEKLISADSMLVGSGRPQEGFHRGWWMKN
jgi:sugar transferase (PEP-CTERM/EpsH1 system associated)